MSIRIAGQVVASAGSLTAHNHDAEAHPEIRALIEQGGGGSVSVLPATEEQAGIVALASQEEALEAFDDSKAMTPLKTAQKVYESVGRVVQLGFDGTLSGNILTFEPDIDIPYEIKNGYSYEIDLLFPAVVADGQLDENIEIVINNNGESIKIVNALHDDTSTNITIGEMKQIMKYSTDIGFRWIFNARFTTTQSEDKVFVMPSTAVNVEGSGSTPVSDNVYTQTNLLGGKDIEIVPEPVEGGIDEHTLACWHFDGKNTDEVTGLALENIGIDPNNPYDTSRMKFGTACIYDFYSSTLKTNDISSLNLTDTDWTLDLWFYQTNYQSSGSGKYGIQTSSKNLLGFKIYKYEIRLEGNMWGKAASTSVATSTQTTWTHAALQYDHLNNKGYFFINGQKVYEGDVTDVTGLTFKDLYLGRVSGPSLLIDELRISNVLRWKEDFEVPTKAYEVAEPTGNMVVNYTGKEVDLSGKADADLGNISENIDYVVESYNDGTNWYRVYKSGWIEQGGQVTGAETYTLLKPMMDTNYIVLVTERDTTAPSQTEGSPRAGAISTTQIYINGGKGSSGTINYYVCGQGA